MFESFSEGLFLILEEHSWAAEAVVVAIVVFAVLFHAEPAKLVPAFFAGHVVAAVGLLDGGLAPWAFSDEKGVIGIL